MTEKLLVSILINNYNYGQFLPEAIDSALAQAYENYEVIVVDDGSTDNSREIIESYGDKIIPVLKANGGQASAFNAGFAVSRGDIICFLDSDDVFLPEKLTEIVKAFTTYTDIDWCFHSLQGVNETLEDLVDTNDSLANASKINIYDLKSTFKSGKLKGNLHSIIPATSGLCFTRYFLNKILPMPETESISLSDNYLKFTAFATCKGLTINKKLSFQRIHGNNAFTLRANRHLVEARIDVTTAYYMRIKFPFLSRYTDKLFAYGLGRYWHNGGIELDSKRIIKEYLSEATFLERCRICFRTVFNYLYLTYLKS